MLGLVTPAIGLGASVLGVSALGLSGLRRRARRGAPAAESEAQPARTDLPAPGDAVLGYMTVLPGTRASARRAAVSAMRAACARSGWRLAGVVTDNERDPVRARPGLARALERIGRGEAAGLLVADAGRPAADADAEAAMAQLLDAVRAAGGGVAVVADEDRAAAVASRRRAAAGQRAAVRRRIGELHSEGLAPQAIAQALNEEGVPPPAPELAWQPWNVRQASGAWPPRGPDRRLPRGRDARAG